MFKQLSIISFKEIRYAVSVISPVLLANKKIPTEWSQILTVLGKSSTPSNLHWFKDLNSRSPFSYIISRSVPSHVVTDIKLSQHTDSNDMQEH